MRLYGSTLAGLLEDDVECHWVGILFLWEKAECLGSTSRWDLTLCNTLFNYRFIFLTLYGRYPDHHSLFY